MASHALILTFSLNIPYYTDIRACYSGRENRTQEISDRIGCPKTRVFKLIPGIIYNKIEAMHMNFLRA